MWFDGVHTYYSWSPRGLLPYKQGNIEIESLAIKCRGCDGKTDSLRGQAIEYRSCTELRVGAYCPKCVMITYARLRVYPWRYTMHREEFESLVEQFRWLEGSHAYATGEFGQQVNPDKSPVGRPVSIRPCIEGVEDKTYMGVFLGHIALGVNFALKDGTIEISHMHYNPAILVPELGRVVFGYQSWWGFIDSPEQLKEITDEVIQDIWYVKGLKALAQKPESHDDQE